MVTNKHISKIIVVVMAAAVVLTFLAMGYSDKLTEAFGGTGVRMEYETKLFNKDEVIDINIKMDEDEWEKMLANAMSEEYYSCDVVVNGTEIKNVAIRPKGNTSLSAIAMDDETDRYSLKLEFDHFNSGQTCFGLDKLILNNNYGDATNMKEAIIYEMYQEIGAVASLYNYAKVSVNGEYWGVYLALEAVEQSFMLRNYGTQDGELYKPESMGMGGGNRDSDSKSGSEGGFPGGGNMPGGGGFNFDPENMPDNFDPQNMPGGGDFNFDPENMPGGGDFNFDAGNMPGAGDSSESGAVESGVGESGVAEVGAAESGAVESTGAESGAAESGAAESDVVESGVAEVGAAESGASESESGRAGFGGPPSGGQGGGFSMGGGGGANLNYTDDELDSYSTIWEGEVTSTGDKDHRRVVTALENISKGENLEKYLDVDNVLKYMAVHTFSVNMDSLSGNMAHNYYLYEYKGQLNIFPWDYNLALGGMSFGGSSGGTDLVNDPIDTPFSGTKFFDALLENEEYRERYHTYLQELVDYVNDGRFDEAYNRIRSLIDPLVETDPTAFYEYDEYQTAADLLYRTIKLRAESIEGQLNGIIPSTDEGQREDSSSLIDASDIDIKAMGQFNMGGSGGNDFEGGRSEKMKRRGPWGQRPGEASTESQAQNPDEAGTESQALNPGKAGTESQPQASDEAGTESGEQTFGPPPSFGTESGEQSFGPPPSFGTEATGLADSVEAAAGAKEPAETAAGATEPAETAAGATESAEVPAEATEPAESAAGATESAEASAGATEAAETAVGATESAESAEEATDSAKTATESASMESAPTESTSNRPSFSGMGMPGQSSGETRAANLKLYGICLGVALIGLLVAVLFKRRR